VEVLAMTLTVHAVFTNGVLRPMEPLSLSEGERVEITISPANSAVAPDLEAGVIQQIQACKSYQEWLEVTKSLPNDDGGYDIVKALNENRRWSGESPRLSKEDRQP
jgi:predicted DNA-binding antitoxin AbrB/MazE fold protein